MNRILVVAAHPDDEVLGCGGTIGRLVKQGAEVHTLILGEGIASRDGVTEQSKKTDIKQLAAEARRANDVLGVKEVYFKNLPDNSFDSLPLLEIVKIVEDVKNDIKPDTIFTHYEKDLNIDHQLTYKAVITAARPIAEESVKEIYSFEVLSSTEWNFPLSFSPDVFFDISKTIEQKLKALKEYKSELRDFPHPRSLTGAEVNARTWGMRAGLEYVEVFKCVRCVK